MLQIVQYLMTWSSWAYLGSLLLCTTLYIVCGTWVDAVHIWYVGWVFAVPVDERPTSGAEFCIRRGVARQGLHSAHDGHISEQHSRSTEIPQPLPHILRLTHWQVRPGSHQLSVKAAFDRFIHKSQLLFRQSWFVIISGLPSWLCQCYLDDSRWF